MNTLVARFSRLFPALLAAVVLGHAVMALARAGGIQGHGCPECGCAVCRPIQVPLKEKQQCWEVECKQICIPPIRWPWEKCCEPRCGKAKTVKVLKKVEYECTKCGYKWEIQAVDCCSCGK